MQRLQCGLVQPLADAGDFVYEFLVRIAVRVNLGNSRWEISFIGDRLRQHCDPVADAGNAERRRPHVYAPAVSAEVERHPDEMNGPGHAATIAKQRWMLRTSGSRLPARAQG